MTQMIVQLVALKVSWSKILDAIIIINSDSQSAIPPVTITTVGKEKIPGNLRRRMDSQVSYSHVLPNQVVCL